MGILGMRGMLWIAPCAGNVASLHEPGQTFLVLRGIPGIASSVALDIGGLNVGNSGNGGSSRAADTRGHCRRLTRTAPIGFTAPRTTSGILC